LVSLAEKRFETALFFKLCHENLSENGLLALNVPAYDGVWRNDLRERLAGIYANLYKSFAEVKIIPGDPLIFLASDSLNLQLTAGRLIQTYDSLGLAAGYLNPALIQTSLNSFKVDQVTKMLEKPPVSNGDLAIGYGLTYYFAALGMNFPYLTNIAVPALIILIILAILFILMLRIRMRLSILPFINILLFGTISFIIELLVIYYLQLGGGYLYQALGIITGLFMAGMAAGSFRQINYNKSRSLPTKSKRGTSSAILLLLLAAVLIWIGKGDSRILLFATAIAGFAGGKGFTANAGSVSANPGIPYGIDLIGALIGTIAGMGLLLSGYGVLGLLLVMAAITVTIFATNVLQISK
jgi:hypothetical protein